MKKVFLLSLLLVLGACNQNSTNSKEENKAKTTSETTETQTETTSEELSLKNQDTFGEDFELVKVKTSAEILEAYQSMTEGDSLKVKFEAKINSVCTKKGCWMRLAIGENEEAFVKFKDYAFFVPKDSAGETAVVNGIAYLETSSVEDQKHMAEDAGKSAEEIAAITQPKSNMAFMATGVKYQLK